MGWLWTTSPSASKQNTEQKSVAEPPSHSPTPIESQPEPTPSIPTQPRRKLTRDEQADLEFQDLLKELNAPPASVNPKPAQSPEPREENEEYSIHPTNLYPRNMSCRAAFDQAFYCQSMGGQFINVYRFGQMRSCSEHWNQFWFCMRTTKSGYGEDKRIQRLKEFHWIREKKYREGPSSEDVWQMRDHMVESPFSADMAAHDEEIKGYREHMKKRYRNFIKDRPLDAPEVESDEV